MKKIIKIIISISIIFSIFTIFDVSAGINGLDTIGDSGLLKQSLDTNNTSGNISDDITGIGKSLLQKIKYVLSGIMLIYLVYAGAQMIMSMGSDDEDLSSSKRAIRYSLIGLVFINIPGTLYEAFVGTNKSVGGGLSASSWNNSLQNSILIDTSKFATTLNNSIVGFIEMMIGAIAIMVIVIAGIKIITSRGREDQITESKNKIIWSVIGLIFIGFIEAWQEFAFTGDVSDGKTIFDTLANLALFLAGPIAIFFLTLAGYYYITSNGEEEKVTKAKNIIINTIIGTVIILCSYVFLNDLASLFIK